MSTTNLGQIFKLRWASSIVKVVLFISNIIFIFSYLLCHLSFSVSTPPLNPLRNFYTLLPGLYRVLIFLPNHWTILLKVPGMDPHLLCLHLYLGYLPQPSGYKYHIHTNNPKFISPTSTSYLTINSHQTALIWQLLKMNLGRTELWIPLLQTHVLLQEPLSPFFGK